VIARNRLLGALDHQRRDLHLIKLSYLTEDRAASTITLCGHMVFRKDIFLQIVPDLGDPCIGTTLRY
jgi:hypothetical protein